MGSTRGTMEAGAPSMKVKVPAAAPTIPPDMGASTKHAEGCLSVPVLGKAFATEAATSCEEEGSMVEQSMKSRGLESERGACFEKSACKMDA